MSFAILGPMTSFTPSSGGLVLPYADVRGDPEPDALLLDFFQSIYDVAADLSGRDRVLLDPPKEQWR